MTDFAKFLSANGLKRKDIASFLGVSGAFITQISSGDRPLPEEKLAMIKANAFGWDISMLTQSEGDYLTLMSGLRPRSESSQPQIRSAVEQALDPTEKFLIGYLERKIENQDAVIRELYKKIGMLEAKLDLARKGEIAPDAEDSSCADVV